MVLSSGRRDTFIYLLGGFACSGMLALTRCAQAPGTPGVAPPTLTPPTFEQVKAFLASFAPSLPVLVKELESTGMIAGVDTKQLDTYVSTFSQLVNQVLPMSSGTDAASIVKDIGSIAAVIMGFIPGAAPFIPILVLLEALISAYLANRPVTDPGGQPVPVPAPISEPQLVSLHQRTLSFTRRR